MLVALHSSVGGVENYVTIDIVNVEEKSFNSSDYDIEFAPNNNPKAKFNYTVANKVVEFDASESYDEDGEIVSYSWDFGDGSNGTGVITSHEYSEDDSYMVKLYVTDDEEGTGSKWKFIEITISEDTGESESDETSGFELILAVCAIALVLFWKRKSNS